jgi:hypothetical protein
MAKRSKRHPDVILIDSDYYQAEGDECQEDCDAALEWLLERVREEYPDATVICEPPHLWQTYLATRPWGKVVCQVPDDWYESSWEPEVSAV